MFKTMKESMAKTPPTICKQQTSQLSLFGSVTHHFACNLTTGISSWKYYRYGVSLPIDPQLVIHILYCAYGNLTTWWVNLTTNVISLTINVDFRLRDLKQLFDTSVSLKSDDSDKTTGHDRPRSQAFYASSFWSLAVCKNGERRRL